MTHEAPRTGATGVAGGAAAPGRPGRGAGDRAPPTFHVAPDHPCLPGHFPDAPVVPGVLLLDHVAGAARAAFGLGALRGLARVKFVAPALPGQDVRIAFAPRDATRIGFTCFVADRPVASGEMAFAP